MSNINKEYEIFYGLSIDRYSFYYDDSSLLSKYTNDAVPNIVAFQKSRSATVGTLDVVTSGDALGKLDFRGVNNNGTPAMVSAAYQQVVSDGTPGTSFVPSRFEWYTGTNAAGPTIKLSLMSDGKLGLGTASPATIFSIRSDTPAINLENSHAGGRNYQIRNGASATGIFDVYDSTRSAVALAVTATGEFRVGTSTNIVGNSSRMFVFGGANGANIDVMGDSTIFGGDQAVIELEGADYSSTAASIAMQYYGSTIAFGTTLGYPNADLGIIRFQGSAASTAIIATMNAYALRFGTDATERMAISATGNVGIANPSPGALLDVGLAGTKLGVVRLAGSTSGNVSLQPNAIAGTNIVLTLPATTGTLVTGGGTASGTNTGDQTITLSSDVTGSGTSGITATIANNVVTNAKLAQMATNTIKGNNTGGTANAIDLSTAQVLTMLNLTSGASVSSVALSAPASVFSVGGSPITSSGTLALSFINQTANRIFAGPATGSPAAPTFRALTPDDIAPGGDSTVFLRGDGSWSNTLLGESFTVGDAGGSNNPTITIAANGHSTTENLVFSSTSATISGFSDTSALVFNMAGPVAIGGGFPLYITFDTTAQQSGLPGFTNALQVSGEDGIMSTVLIAAYSASTSNIAKQQFYKSRSAISGTYTDIAIASGDVLGRLEFLGSNSTPASALAAYAQVVADGSVGASFVPSRFEWYTGTNAAGPTLAMTLNSTGKLLLSTTSTALTVNSIIPHLQILGTADASTTSMFGRWSADAVGPVIEFTKSRNATIGSNTVTVLNDVVGKIDSWAINGNGSPAYANVAFMQFVVDQTPGTTFVPGRIEFFTASGSANPALAVTIDQTKSLYVAGNLGVKVLTTAGASFMTAGSGVFTGSDAYIATGIKLSYNSGSFIESSNNSATPQSITMIGSTYNLQAGSSFITGLAITANGQVIVGPTTSAVSINSVNPQFEVVGTTNATTSSVLGRWSNDAVGSILYFSKSRNTTIGSNTVVTSGDILGKIDFMGSNSNGTSVLAEAAYIQALADGSPGTTFTPGRFEWFTGTNAAAPAIAMKLDSSKNLTVTGAIQSTAQATTTNALGTVTSTATANWTTAGTNTATFTTATNCTLSFTAPLNANTKCVLKVTQPASGTVVTCTFPATMIFQNKFILQPVPILGATTIYEMFYDGTNYYVMDATASAGSLYITQPITATSTVATGATYYSSSFPIPANSLQVGTSGRFKIFLTNTGTANALTVALKYGTAGTTADTTINGSFVTNPGAAVATVGVIEITWICRTIGASGVIDVTTVGTYVTTAVTPATANSIDSVSTRTVHNAATVNTTTNNFLGIVLNVTSGTATTLQAIIPEVISSAIN